MTGGCCSADVVIEVGVPGPRGPAGVGLPAGGAPGQGIIKTSSADYAVGWADLESAGLSLSMTAGESLGGHRAVRIATGNLAVYASASQPSTVSSVVGITSGAAALGDTVLVLLDGSRVAEPSWAWAVGPVYLGENGLLTQTLPSVGAVKEIGVALSATELLVRIQPEIVRG